MSYTERMNRMSNQITIIRLAHCKSKLIADKLEAIKTKYNAERFVAFHHVEN